MNDRNTLDYSLKLIVKSSFVVFIGLFLSKLFMFLYRTTIARYFGPEVYGLYSLSIMIISWFVVFSFLGLHNGITRYIPIYRGKRQLNKIRYLFKSVFLFLFFTSFIFGIFLFFSSELISINIFHNHKLILFLQIFSIAVPLIVLSQLFIYLLLAYEKINWYSFIYNILQDFVKVFILVLFVLLGFGINSLFASYLLGILSAFLTSYFICRYYFDNIFKKSNLNKKQKSKIFKHVFSYSWPLLFFGIAFAIFIYTDSFLIGYFIDAENVGYYNSAIPIATLLIVLSEFFTKLFSPLITKTYYKNQKNLKLIKELSKQVGKWIFLFNLPILILMLFFPEEIIKILFGEQYIIAANSLRFLSIGMFFNSLTSVSQRLIKMIGKSKLILINISFIAIINIILNIIFIQKYGISGAAFATMLSLILLNIIFMAQSYYYLSIIPLRRKMLKIFFISIIPTLISLCFINPFQNLSLLIFIFILIFFFLLYFILILFFCLDKNDILILKSITKKFRK